MGNGCKSAFACAGSGEKLSKSDTFDAYLQGLGLRIESERKFGNMGLRWAAMQAGLGVIRKNNFFYTESGSSVFIEAWFIDREMKRKELPHLPPCLYASNKYPLA